MIDCHTHIIPNLDDGAASFESSLRAIGQMSEGGISSVILTSHYMRGLYQYSHEDYEAKFRELEAEVKHLGIPITLYPGAEVFLSPGIEEDIKKHGLTLAGSSYVLVETDLNGFPADMNRNIFELLRAGFKPILAHAERYVSVMTKSREAREMINHSVYIQVSAPSVIGGYGDKVKETAWKLLNNGWAHLLGSDHHCRSDYSAFFKARDKIIKHIDAQTAELLTMTHPQAVLDDRKMDFDYVFIQPSPKKHSKNFFRSLGL